MQFPGKEKMLITDNAFGQNGFNLGSIVVAPYLWQKMHSEAARLLAVRVYEIAHSTAFSA